MDLEKDFLLKQSFLYVQKKKKMEVKGKARELRILTQKNNNGTKTKLR